MARAGRGRWPQATGRSGLRGAGQALVPGIPPAARSPPEHPAQDPAPSPGLRGSPAFQSPRVPVTQLFCPAGHTEKSMPWPGGLRSVPTQPKEAKPRPGRRSPAPGPAPLPRPPSLSSSQTHHHLPNRPCLPPALASSYSSRKTRLGALSHAAFQRSPGPSLHSTRPQPTVCPGRRLPSRWGRVPRVGYTEDT